MPAYANCVTAVRHLMHKASSAILPHDWVGNLPRYLVCKNGWTIKRIKIEDMRIGDLLFLKEKDAEEITTHVVIAIAVDRVFHCTDINRGGVIEAPRELFCRYTQIDSSTRILAYIDPRTLDCYRQEEEALITNSSLRNYSISSI